MSVKWAQTQGCTYDLPMVSALQEHHHLRPRDGTQGHDQEELPAGSQPVSPCRVCSSPAHCLPPATPQFHQWVCGVGLWFVFPCLLREVTACPLPCL